MVLSTDPSPAPDTHSFCVVIIGKSREDSDLNDFLDVGRFLVTVLPLRGHGSFRSSAVFFFSVEITGNLKAKGSQYCVQGEQSQHFRCTEGKRYPLVW